jgi:hypothetical protein
MIKWGLGIEHEMRVRFTNKISENHFFSDIKEEYIFIDSNTILYYFKLYEQIIMIDFIKYISNKEEQEYFDKILLKNNLYKKAINKIPFPLNSLKKHKDYIELLNYYLIIYTLFNAPLLFFTYNYNNENIIPSIYNSLGNIEILLTKLYNQEAEKKVLNDLKQLFINKNIDNCIMHIHNEEIQIYFKHSINNNKLDINTFFKKLENNLEQIKSIFTQLYKYDYNHKFYKNLYILYKNCIPHIDNTYKTHAIEFKTIYYENLNFEKSLNDLIDLEKTFFTVINNIPLIKNLTNMFGDLIYHNIGSIQKTICIIDIINLDYQYIEEDYTGSYHIWITAPHKDNITQKKFINIHTTLANKLQLLEPILAAHYSSPSYNAKLNTESKASLRQFLNGYSNYGTTDISLMNGTKKHEIYEYYLSKDDIINNNPMKISYKDSNQHNVYTSKGKHIINYDKLITRSITNNIFNLFNKGNNESNDINVKNYFSLIFEKTTIRPKFEIDKHKYLQLGADIRTRKISKIFNSLDEKWERYYLLKNNKLVQIYYNKTINKFSYKKVLRKKKVDKVGIEFRILDHFPTCYLDQILGLLVPIILDCLKPKYIKSIKDTYVSKQFWHNEMAKVIMLGYKYTLSKTYITNLEKEFNIKIKYSSLHSEDILKILFNKLSKKHKESSILYNKMRFKSNINFINFNKIAWNEINK